MFLSSGRWPKILSPPRANVNSFCKKIREFFSHEDVETRSVATTEFSRAARDGDRAVARYGSSARIELLVSCLLSLVSCLSSSCLLSPVSCLLSSKKGPPWMAALLSATRMAGLLVLGGLAQKRDCHSPRDRVYRIAEHALDRIPSRG